MVCLPFFILASGIQHDCHKYLASLKKYTLPTHPVFSQLISPHYTAESVIYLTLAVIAAPQGSLLNKTLLTAFIFTIVNLGVTAGKTRIWYEKRFGAESIKGRWRIVPFVY